MSTLDRLRSLFHQTRAGLTGGSLLGGSVATAICLTILVVIGSVHAEEIAYDPAAEITMATNADPVFNPWYPGVGIESNLINELLFDGLTRFDATMEVQPRLATAWRVSEDGLTWTFDLREGVTWHDGEPFSAQDVAYTFNEVVLAKNMGATNATIYSAVDRVDIIDDYTVAFELTEPFSSLPEYLAYYEGILPAHIFSGVDNPWDLASFNKKNPVGTGAFKIADYRSGASIRLTRNEAYWDGVPKIQAVTFRIVPDTDSQVAQMLSGSLDLVSVDDPTLLARLTRVSGLEVDLQSENVYYFAILNQNDERFQDVRVRQALLHAIDREAIIASVLQGYGSVATGPIAPVQQQFYTDDVRHYDYNPERAKELLAAAGWEQGSSGYLEREGERLSITIDQGEFGPLVPIAVLIQQYWLDVGVDVTLNVMEWNAYLTKTYVNRDYEATICWWRTPPTPDIAPYYHSNAAASGNNWPDYRSDELDALLEAELGATSLEEKQRFAREIQEFVAEELPYLYLYFPDLSVVRNTKLKGMVPSNLPTSFQYSAEWYVSTD